MNRTIIAIAVVISTSPLMGADNLAFFSNVTNLWYQGYKSNVLAIAEERLALDGNDAAGLVLKMEYDMEFLNFGTLSNSVISVMRRFQDVSSTNRFWNSSIFTASLTHLLDIQTNSVTYECADEDRAKAALPSGRMLYEDIIKWICLGDFATNCPSVLQ